MKCVPLNSQNLFIWTLIFILTLWGTVVAQISWNRFGNWKVPGLIPGFNLWLDFLLLLFPWVRSFTSISSHSYPAVKLGQICILCGEGTAYVVVFPIHALYTYQGCFLRVLPLNFISIPKIELFQPEERFHAW